MNKCTWFFTLGLFLVSSFDGFSITKTALSSGLWRTGTRWSPAGAPACGDVVIIPAGITITVDASVILDGACVTATTINIYGTLTFDNGGPPTVMRLALGSGVSIYPGGTLTRVTGPDVNQLYIGGASVYNGSTTVSVTGPKGFGNSPLPIVLISFSAKAVATGIELAWSTSTEKNLDHFEVERSSDGYLFSTVATMSGQGISSQRKDYKLIDLTPVVGKNYYRLKSIDFDNYTEVFNVVLAEFKADMDFFVSPNPTSGDAIHLKLNFHPDQGGSITFFSDMGVKVSHHAVDAHDTKIIFDSPLTSGLYYAKVESGNFSKVVRFVVD